jgi:hypothetical protein
MTQLADDFEERLQRTFSGGTEAEKHRKRHWMAPMLTLAPIIRRHAAQWAAFQATDDPDAWDAHLLQLGEALSALESGARSRHLERFVCISGAPLGCECTGCAYMADLRLIEADWRDHARIGGENRRYGSPALWIRGASAYHATWLARQKASSDE